MATVEWIVWLGAGLELGRLWARDRAEADLMMRARFGSGPSLRVQSVASYEAGLIAPTGEEEEDETWEDG